MCRNYYLILDLIFPIFVILFAALQWHISKQKKNNDLFQIRYDFYKKVEKAWLSNIPKVSANNHLKEPHELLEAEELYEVLEDDLKPMAIETKFVFGTDIYEHIMSLAHEFHKGNPDYPEEWFIKPFEKYLILK